MRLAILLISRISILRICGKAIRRTRFLDLFVEFYENLKPDELIKSADKGIFEFLLVSGMKEIARISVNDDEPAIERDYRT